MEKRNYNTQQQDLADRLERFLQAKGRLEKRAVQEDEPAKAWQLARLAELGIRPKWQASEAEADEMICHYRTILGLGRLP